MSNRWFQFVVASVAVLVMAVLVSSSTKIPLSGLVASIIDAIPGIDLTGPVSPESVPTEPASDEPDSTSLDPVPTETIPDESVSTEPASDEPVPIEISPTETATEAPTDKSIFAEILNTVTTPIKNFLESDPVHVEQKPASEPVPETASPKKDISRLKIFILTQDALESTVNEWLAAQQGIIVNEIKVSPYEGGAYLVVMNYHAGGIGNTSTRLKLFAAESPEADANTFLSSLDASQAVRSIAVVAGSYFGSEKTGTIPLIFIVYE